MSSLAWTAVIPVKRPSIAKTRLIGADIATRRDLALAFAADTVAAVADCEAVTSILVVTDDEEASAMARALGALAVPDTPDAGLNPALRHGAELARSLRGDCAVAAVSSDLPALRPSELAAALQACARHPRAFVCDTVGTGTTLLSAAPSHDLTPRFGPRSRAWHRHTGCVEILAAGLASLRRAVDTWADLSDARRLGVGAATAAVLARR
jgi:2-phospho-L-lactate/phosphoenolpyruvate guanylyltransferase